MCRLWFPKKTDLCNQACSLSMIGPCSKGPPLDTRHPGLHDLIAQVVSCYLGPREWNSTSPPEMLENQ